MYVIANERTGNFVRYAIADGLNVHDLAIKWTITPKEAFRTDDRETAAKVMEFCKFIQPQTTFEILIIDRSRLK